MVTETRTIIIKQKLWNTKVFENATFNIDNWMIEMGNNESNFWFVREINMKINSINK
jgi:hypothetical protein